MKKEDSLSSDSYINM